VIVDTGKGVASLVVQELFKSVPGKFIHMSSDFLNPKNAEKTEKKVLLEKADLGVAFDGDGDRILFINEKGQRIHPDLIATLLIHYYFKNTGEILCTVVSSRNLKEKIKKSNNSLVISKVGHTFVKEKMAMGEIIFGCEPSGHYYFRENYFIESPFIVLLKILEILSKTKKPLSELVKPFQRYYLERINFKIKNVGSRVSNIMRRVEKKYKKIGKISRIDGLTIEFSDWWFNIRASHTEPVIRLTIEANSKELLEQKKKELANLIGIKI
jgi:phosphomannomutase